MIKLIASDIDGTLITKNHIITERTKKAIKMAKDQGIHFMICTGRSLPETPVITSQLDFPCEILALNGSCIYDEDQQIIYEVPIEPDLVDHFYEIAERFDAPCIFHSGNKSCFTISYPYFLEKLDAFYQSKDWKRTKESFLPIVSGDVFSIDYNEIKKIPVYKVEYCFMVPSQREQVYEAIKRLNVNISSDGRTKNIEITSIDADKGKTLLKFCQSKGIKEDEVLVFGDGDNDISMLENFTHSYCMGNGSDEVKVKAKHICDTNDNDGLAKVLEQYFKGEK